MRSQATKRRDRVQETIAPTLPDIDGGAIPAPAMTARWVKVRTNLTKTWPVVTFAGPWLAEIGIDAGDELDIECSEGQIVLTRRK